MQSAHSAEDSSFTNYQEEDNLLPHQLNQHVGGSLMKNGSQTMTMKNQNIIVQLGSFQEHTMNASWWECPQRSIATKAICTYRR